MIITRRRAILSTLFGTGMVGLRALATGLPASLLANPREALAAGMCADKTKAQFFILSTCGSGDPLNANCPGSYVQGVTHPDWTQPLQGHSFTSQTMQMTLGGQQYTCAPPWAALQPQVLARTTFWHLMTNTPVHPKEPDVLKLMGATPQGEMLPSLLAKAMAPCLNTIQAQPISVGAASPSEALSFGGAPQATIPPTALRATLTSPAGPLTNLQALRDSTMKQLYDLYKTGASPAQQAYIDQMVTSQDQVRNINQNLLGALDSIKDNSVASQITAAITLIQMNITPVVAIHIPWGGDNHRDVGLATEAQQTADAVVSVQSLMDALASAKLQDQVTFMTLHVFGRTLGPSNTNGRQHNEAHQVSLTIGSRFKPGVIGALTQVGNDYGATNIDSKSGTGTSSGDIKAVDTLASFGMTMLSAVGADPTVISSPSTTGKVISAGLVSP